jgi:ABC-2 type transport system permease protein
MSNDREEAAEKRMKERVNPGLLEHDEETNGAAVDAAPISESSGERAAMSAGGNAAIGTGERVSSARNVFTIAGRELRSYFDSPVAYIVLCISTLAIGAWFFFVERAFWEVNRATANRMFDGLLSLPVMSIIIIPLITMRALAEEKRSGTLELLITLPVRDSDVILGKYLGALSIYLLMLAASLLYPIAMFVWPWHLGTLDWGPVWSAYLGLVLYGMAGIGIGMVFSSITESQIIAFFVSLASLALLYSIGGIVEYFHGWLGDAIAFISFQSRFAPFARGLIDTRAVVYFLSITILCLLISFRSLESRKWS